MVKEWRGHGVRSGSDGQGIGGGVYNLGTFTFDSTTVIAYNDYRALVLFDGALRCHFRLESFNQLHLVKARVPIRGYAVLPE